jgi:hypothetical protein
VWRIREEYNLDNEFKPISGIGKIDFGDFIKKNNIVNDSVQRIHQDSIRNTQRLANDIFDQKQEEKRLKEKDSKNLELTAQNAEEIKTLLSSMNQTLDMIVHKIGQEAQLTRDEQREMNKLLFEIKDIVLSEEANEEKRE